MHPQGTLLDAVGRAKHTLIGARGGGAGVTVHGMCPISSCGTISVVSVRAETTSVTCVGCGTAFDV